MSMSEQDTARVNAEYVSRSDFDAFVLSITERVEAEEKLNDFRMKRIEAIMEKNMADVNAAINLLAEKTQHGFNLLNERISKVNDRITATNERIDHVEKFFNEKIEHVTDTLTVAINGVNQRIDDMQTEHNKSLTKWGIGVAIAIGLFQAAVSIALHFWG